jgi:hypothetical protein
VLRHLTGCGTGTRVLSEGCTHHRQCDDIGRVKLPALDQESHGAGAEFRVHLGLRVLRRFVQIRLVIHCGGCMLNEREMKYRQKCAVDQNVPITNYGSSSPTCRGFCGAV